MMQWLKDLADLNVIKIPQCVILIEFRGYYSMHTFWDASSSNNACVVYLRTEGKGGVHIQLLQTKSRVAPLQKTTIPRLELLACCIGARLAYSMKESMTLEDVSSFFWTGWTTVLYWIKNKENCGTFVNNKVKEINQLSTAEM
ncbi:pro-Pol polyprotein [Trichonephila inaurata madagascariensis]|uniref:Pro-Pol polyprotein n=1 Tax=Trichonephila inaurata madagascariensis TaxID=2747483 RepID=A0A8X7BTK4_9ARAC|nr:pro-Pol polyprotein [Trichonephila inaurata madagascariensis]